MQIIERYTWAALVTALCLLLSSCLASTPVKDYEGADKGYLLLSISATPETQYGAYWIDFSMVGESRHKRAIYYQNNIFYGDERDFDDSEANGVVKAFPMRPGNYEIISYTVKEEGNGPAWSPREKLSIPFSVAPGQVTYLGAYLAHKQTAKNMLGITIPYGAWLKIEDRLERDLEIAARREPINPSAILKQIPPRPHL